MNLEQAVICMNIKLGTNEKKFFLKMLHCDAVERKHNLGFIFCPSAEIIVVQVSQYF